MNNPSSDNFFKRIVKFFTISKRNKVKVITDKVVNENGKSVRFKTKQIVSNNKGSNVIISNGDINVVITDETKEKNR